MRICPTCGEVYPDRATRCRAHDAPLLDWDGSSDTHPALTTDVEGRAVAPETPLELRVVAGEISPTSLHVGRVEVARGDTPRVMVAGDTPRSRAPSLGRVLGGRYRLGPQLGVGGYGAVFAATDEQTGARVAIKVLSPAAAQSPELLTRFHREAIAASRARHPHVVEVSDFDVDVDGTQYIVMEHLDGNDLSKTLDEVGALSPVRALTIAAQCARGLAAVHRVGILHRDLKPANVFLVRHDGGAEVVKIIDFGISKLTRAAGDYTDVTSASKVVGTPCYMAPEQARGAPLDVRTDVYALGVMLFEMLVGERPFTGRAPIEVLTKHLQAPRVAPSTRRPELARCPGLDALVVTALAADPERRHASMVVFGEAMIACLRAIDPTAAAGVAAITGELTGARARAARSARSSSVTRGRGTDGWRRGVGVGVGVGALAVAIVAVIAVVTLTGRGGAGRSSAPPPDAATAVTAAPPIAVPVAVAVPVPVAVAPGDDVAPPEVAPPEVAPPEVAIDPADDGTAADPGVAAPPPTRTADPSPLARAHEVEITSSPRGATVLHDGAALGVTPLRVVLEPGVASMDLALEAPGRRRRRVTVGRDRDAVEVTLPRRAGKAPPAASTLGVEEW